MDSHLYHQIQIAKKLVKAMPHWKQNILAQSASPTVSVPRTPIKPTMKDEQR